MKPYEVWWAEVYCPEGMWPTSGGESNNSDGGVILHSSVSFLYERDGWKVTVSNQRNADATFSVWVVCFGGLSQIAASQWYSEVALNSWGSYTEKYCVSSSVPQLVGGGGFTEPNSSGIDINAAYALNSRDWYFQIFNYESRWLRAWGHAVCTTGIGNYTMVWGPYAEAAPGRMATSVAVCPPGTWVVGGGAYGSHYTRITDSYPVGEGWRSYVHNRGQGTGYTQANAICGT